MVVLLGASLNWVEVEFQGTKYRIPALKYQGRLWFHWQGETHVLDNLEGTRSKRRWKGQCAARCDFSSHARQNDQGRGKDGDAVSKGQALVVMEAMKMEYTLEADRDGKVEEVLATTGAQVTLGQVLVRVGEK